ncbi:hypothetical protein [Rhodococcus sp. (in: high G+C Gram-positive bacteria)]|uniref:hypothetical protein n=1 Tax=Rhodococcus sp. TaxID=1831 RepID=UPI003890505F
MPPSHEEPRGLLDGLLTGRYDSPDDARDVTGPLFAPPIVPARAITVPPGRDLVVELDTSGPPPAPAGWRPVRYQIGCTPEVLDDVLAFTAPAPLAVYVDGPDDTLADTARALTEAGHVPGLPAGHGPGAISDFLAVLAHADTGYVARTTSTEDVVALLSGTAAALSGFDIREALASPDVSWLQRLIPEAAAALREILLAVEVDDPDRVARELGELGLSAG